MGCEFSRLFVWWSKPGRKRLWSGDSDFRQDSDEKADDEAEGLRKMFSRKKSKEKEKNHNATLPGKTTNDFSTRYGSSVDLDAESAVRNRNTEQLLLLVQGGGDGFNFLTGGGGRFPKRLNPVELACSLGYFDIVELFLQNGCSPNLPTSAGKLLHTVLESIKSHNDCLEPGRTLLKHLICLGCDLDIKDWCGVTPLMHCAQIGDHELMRMVLEKCSDRQLTCHCSGSLYTPLHMSAMKGEFECVKLLLSRSPHKHVNEKDKAYNTALHLALKSMLHNIPYLNAAKENLEFSSAEQSREKAAACQRLMSFQQNAVAIVEALVMAGAEVHAHCCQPSRLIRNVEEFYPLVYALHLCARDHTLGFELDPIQFSSTLNLVSRRTIQSLEGLGKTEPESSASLSQMQVKENETNGKFSPYAGVVRLLVLAGTEVTPEMRKHLYHMFDSPSIHTLLDEVCAFWDKYQVSRPAKLIHLSKLAIRVHLANVHKLHGISRLPLPPRMKEYLKLNYL
ncbi:hypothetical protein ACOMHN_015634 [Nucella lapillus]